MQIYKLLKIIDEHLPAGTAMEGDKIGLQIQAGRENAEKILVTMEVNEKVIEEASNLNCQCIITFHPLIFHPMTEIIENDRVGRLVSLLIKKSIALISVHTAFDAFIEGTSKIFADKLGFSVDGFLVPDEKYEGHGMGVIAVPPKPLSEEELLESVAGICMSPLKFCSGAPGKKINKVAIVGGSGTSFLGNAFKSEADAFITADISYHRFHEAAGKMMLVDPGHYEMEQFVSLALAEFLNEKTENEIKNVYISKILTNPVKYYPETQSYIEKQKMYLLNI